MEPWAKSGSTDRRAQSFSNAEINSTKGPELLKGRDLGQRRTGRGLAAQEKAGFMLSGGAQHGIVEGKVLHLPVPGVTGMLLHEPSRFEGSVLPTMASPPAWKALLLLGANHSTTQHSYLLIAPPQAVPAMSQAHARGAGAGAGAGRGDCPRRLEGALQLAPAASQKDGPARALLGAQPRCGHRPAGPRRRLPQPEELTSSLHTFKNKAFKKSKVCGVCKQIIDGQGISCRACKYSCHKKCEAKVVIPCGGQARLEQACHRPGEPRAEAQVVPELCACPKALAEACFPGGS
ncbi:hypothetical protein H8957_001516 [Semnopithecus entellus]